MKVIIACIFIFGSIMATSMAKVVVVTQTAVENKVVYEPKVVTEVVYKVDHKQERQNAVVTKTVTEKVVKKVNANGDEHLAGVAVQKVTKIVTVKADKPVVVTKVEREVVHAKVIKTVIAKV